MTIEEFPAVEDADETGLLAVGGDLELDSLLLAYRSGVFPWPMDQNILLWFAPPQRALLSFDALNFNRSLRRALKESDFRFGINVDFDAVIHHCSELKNRKRQKGTWITPDIINAYRQLHARGYAHSFECYRGNDLVGGTYGVSIGKMFAAESMFYRSPNASKLALLYGIQFLQSQGVTWIDGQVMNPFLSTLGFAEVPREEFMEMLKKALEEPNLAFPSHSVLTLEELKIR